MNTVASGVAVKELTAEDCFDRLSEALAASATQELLGLQRKGRLDRRFDPVVSADFADLDQPGWVRHQLSWWWLASLTLPFSVGGRRVRTELRWPVRLPEGDVRLPRYRESEISLGGHTGLFLGRPIVAAHGLRLREGLHFIPRPEDGGRKWVVEVVFAPTLGRQLRLKVRDQGSDPWVELGTLLAAGERSGRYVSPDLVRGTLASLDITAETVDAAEVSAAVWERYRSLTGSRSGGGGPVDLRTVPRRTAESRNRLFGSDEAMAELVLGYFARLTTLTKEQVEPLTVPNWASRFAERVAQAGEAAVAAMATGREGVRSVVAPLEAGMTLARVEQEARTCFGGFRGLGPVRGRADLRDLEPGWRNLLCPVQTPEAEDVGLVRYAALATRADAQVAADADAQTAPDGMSRLSQWLDLSASAGLIPFINHDDPARASIGSKNLKQSVPVRECEPPLIATGWERILGLAAGTARVPGHLAEATVTQVGPEFVTISASGSDSTIRFGVGDLGRSGVENRWEPCVETGERITGGTIVAHAPDVVVHRRGVDGQADAELCLGVNALVALTPWYGFNHEDGIVVSRSFADRLTSNHLLKVDVPAPPGECYLDWPVIGGQVRSPARALPWSVDQGEALVEVVAGSSRKLISSPVTGEVLRVTRDRERGSLSFVLRVERPLAVGDKVSNRHQGKGVVSVILPDDDLPVVAAGPLKGRRIDVILNPVGVLRRLNIGQLWEMHYGLEAMLVAPDSPGQVTVGRRADNPEGLAARLADLEAPLGRLPLVRRDGSLVGGPDGVVVGPQYLVKLNHLASAKISTRGGDNARSMITGQPTQHSRYDEDHWVGSAQRLGEMEVWALEASGADEVLADALQDRSAVPGWAARMPRESLRSVQAHLAVAGLELVVNDTESRPLQHVDRTDIDQLAVRWRPGIGSFRDADGHEHVVLGQPEDTLDWRALWPTTVARQQWLGRPGRRPEKFEQLKWLVESGKGEAAVGAIIGASVAEVGKWRESDSEFDDLFAGQAEQAAASAADRDDAPQDAAPATRGLDLLYKVPEDARPGDDEIVRWAIPLPRAIEHPWGKDLPWIRSVPVLPARYRLRNASGPRGLDKLYLELAGRLVDFEAELLARNAQTGSYDSAHWAKVRQAVRAILGRPSDERWGLYPDSIHARLRGKRGLLRRYLLGQATVFSGRSVMTPNWHLPPDEVGLPAKMLKELGLPYTEADLERVADLDRVVVVNRQPSLHPYSLVALKCRPVDGDAIGLHPLVLKGLAGDFDGDTIAVHRPSSPSARQNAWQTLSPVARLRSSANGQILAKFDLDIVLGLYLGRHEPTLGALVPTLPDKLSVPDGDGELLTTTFSTALRDALAEQVSTLVDRPDPDPDAAVHLLASLEALGVDRAVGWSIGALDLLAGPTGEHLREAVAADVAGKESARHQLLVERGKVPGAHPGNETPDVKDNFLHGLTPDDYFGTAPGALASLAVKKLTAPQAGALTKTLVEIADAVVISANSCDLHVDERFTQVQKSPLTCRAPNGICQACYGADPGTGKPPALGARIGVLAATLIGERSTELSMKAFHGGGGAGDAVEGDIDELKAVFGQGRSTGLASTGDRTAQTLEAFLDHADPLSEAPRLMPEKEPALSSKQWELSPEKQAEPPERTRTKLPTRKQRARQHACSVEALQDPRTRASVLAPVVAHAVRTLRGDVDTVHVEVLLRQLFDTWCELDELRRGAPEGRISLATLAQRRGRTGFELATSRGKVSWLLAPDGDDHVPAGVRSRLVAGNVPHTPMRPSVAEVEIRA